MISGGGGPIALAAGGTGGHMFPAEALAQELKRRGRKVLLVTDARGARYTSNFPADETVELSAASPNVGGMISKLSAGFSIAGGLLKAIHELRKRKIAAAVGFGGYPSFAGMKAASFLGIPYGVHEQNGVLGRANRQLANSAAFTAHAFPVLDKVPQKVREHLIEVGNPVRDSVKAGMKRPYALPVGDEPIRILIFGGSQGASLFSTVPPKVIVTLGEDLHRRIEVTHQARESEVAGVETIYDKAGVSHNVAPFFSDLPERIAGSHLVISRAGASTVTELSIIGRPSILVPLAIAMDDHQSGNARVLSEAGGAILLPEKEFNETSLAAALSPLLDHPAELADMAAKARSRVREGAAAALADLVETIARK